MVVPRTGFTSNGNDRGTVGPDQKPACSAYSCDPEANLCFADGSGCQSDDGKNLADCKADGTCCPKAGNVFAKTFPEAAQLMRASSLLQMILWEKTKISVLYGKAHLGREGRIYALGF